MRSSPDERLLRQERQVHGALVDEEGWSDALGPANLLHDVVLFVKHDLFVFEAKAHLS